MKRIRQIALFLILLLSTTAWIFSQEKSLETVLSEKDDPVVALVLAGGGALGFAHVGVIKVLEEEGIHPDMVLGASIGSIIGGLYGAGYSPEELESVINDTDWKSTLTDSYVRGELSFEQKERQARYRLSVGAREDKDISNAGFSHAQHVMELLDNLLAPYSVEMDFDDLPIPFRAIGTDLISGEEIVYGEGDLKTVIRASMAVPGVFTPVEYKGRYVIDGGWSDNLPSLVAREMGADIVIAVSLFSLEKDIEKLSSATAVTLQSDLIRTVERQQASLDASDLVISPDLTGYNQTDFEKGRSMMALGYKAASEMRDEIRALSNEIGHRNDPSPVKRVAEGRVNISKITVYSGGDAEAEKNIRREIQETIGREASFRELRAYLYSFYDRGSFTHFWYRLEPVGTDSFHLIVHAPPLTRAYERFSSGIDFSSQMIESHITEFTLKTAYQRWYGEQKNNAASFELWLSDFPSLIVGLEHTVPDGKLQMGAETYLLSRSRYFFKDDTVESLYGLQTLGGRLYIKRPFFKRMDLGLHVYTDYNWIEKRLGGDLAAEENWAQYGGKILVKIDTLDRTIAPRRGRKAAFLIDYSFDEEGQSSGIAAAAGEWYLPLADGLILIPRGEFQGLLWGSLSAMEQPSLGQSITLHAYYPQELRGDNVAMAGLALRKQIGSLPLGLGNEIYFQLAGNSATLWEEDAVESYRDFHYFSGGAAGLVMNTLIGEIQLNFAFNEDGRFSSFLGVSTSLSFMNGF